MSHIYLELEWSPEFPLPERANLKWFLNEFSHTQSWYRYKNTVQSNTATIRAMLLFNTGKHAVFGHAWTRTATHASTSAWYLSVFSTYTLEYLCNRSGYCRNLGSLRAGTRHHGDFSVMGNFFPSTFPEVLLAHASQMTGQLSQSMQIRRARDSINAMLATIISESDTEHRKLRSSEHGVYRDVSFPLSGNRGYDSNRSVPLSSCHETSRRFLRYGNDIKSRRERGYEALPQNTADRIRT